MKILIIGGSGFIGKSITDYLVKQGHQVVLFNRGNNVFKYKFHQIIGDKNKLETYKKDFEKIKPEIVIHSIAYTENDAYIVCKTFKDITRRVLILSSGDVYEAYSVFKDGGNTNNFPLCETSMLRSAFYPYRKESSSVKDALLKELYFNYDKLQVEKIIQESGLSYTILRLAAVYGLHDPQMKIQRYVKEVFDNDVLEN